MTLFCRTLALRLQLSLLFLYQGLKGRTLLSLYQVYRQALREQPLIFSLPKVSEKKALPPFPSISLPPELRLITRPALQDLQRKVLLHSLEHFYGITPSNRVTNSLSRISSLPWICRQLHRAAGLGNRLPAVMDDFYRIRVVFPAFAEALSLQIRLKDRDLSVSQIQKQENLYPAALNRSRRRYKKSLRRMRERDRIFRNSLNYELIRLQMLTELNVCTPNSCQNRELNPIHRSHPHLLSLVLSKLKTIPKARRLL